MIIVTEFQEVKIEVIGEAPTLAVLWENKVASLEHCFLFERRGDEGDSRLWKLHDLSQLKVHPKYTQIITALFDLIAVHLY